jgi:hypothetical protein
MPRRTRPLTALSQGGRRTGARRRGCARPGRHGDSGRRRARRRPWQPAGVRPRGSSHVLGQQGHRALPDGRQQTQRPPRHLEPQLAPNPRPLHGRPTPPQPDHQMEPHPATSLGATPPPPTTPPGRHRHPRPHTPTPLQQSPNEADRPARRTDQHPRDQPKAGTPQFTGPPSRSLQATPSTSPARTTPPGPTSQLISSVQTPRMSIRTNEPRQNLAVAAMRLPPGVILDGEAVVYLAGEDGTVHISFAAAQSRALSRPRRARELADQHPATYVAFDILAHPAAGFTSSRPSDPQKRRSPRRPDGGSCDRSLSSASGPRPHRTADHRTAAARTRCPDSRT